jgi:hypothetical protein
LVSLGQLETKDRLGSQDLLEQLDQVDLLELPEQLFNRRNWSNWQHRTCGTSGSAW